MASKEGKINKYKILGVVDMQNDFISGSLPAEEGDKIIPRIVEKMQDPKYYKVILTKDTHFKDYLDTEEGKKLPIEHCIRDTEGWELIDEIKELVENDQNKYIVLEKMTPGSNILFTWLNANNNMIDYVEFVGVCTDICVLSNVVMAKTALLKSTVVVDARGCAGTTVDNHNKALDLMKNNLMVDVY